MKYAVSPPARSGVTADPEWIAAYAAHVEACGFESLVLVEHPLVVGGYSSVYPYSRSGRMPLADDCVLPDPLDVLAFLAATTSTLGLATGVLVLPAHHPVVLAKRLATIDRLCGGRLRLCIGLGWMREEIEATGADFASRGRRADEAIDLMRALWADSGPDGATFEGEHFTVRRGHSYPKPTRPIPIHIGGHSAAAARRAGRRGDGLQPLGVDTAEVTRLWALTCEEAAACGRDPDQLELTLGGVLAAATAEREVSADRLVLSATGDLHDLAEACDEVSAAAQRLQL